MNNTAAARNTTTANILAAVRTAHGDFRATMRITGRWCSEELAQVAAELEIPSKFATDSVPTWRTLTRDEAVRRLAGWCSWRSVKEWAEQFEASCQAARAEFPQAIAELGAAL
jgi:hypothetical protein